jgi:hypothetical protein
MIERLQLRNKFIAFIVYAVAIFVSTSSFSATLYLATGSHGVNGELYTIDPATGSVISDIGPLVDALGNHYGMTGLRFNTTNGIFYGSTATQSPTNPGYLVTVNPLTGLVTPVGSFGIGGTGTMSDLAFDATTGDMYGVTGATQNCYRINQLTGAATAIGNTGTGIQDGGGLVANSAGTVYGTNQASLYTYDKFTGAGSFVALIDDSDAHFDSLAFSSSNVLYGVEHSLHVANTRRLRTIDTATGVTTILGFTVANADALEFAPTSVPEPSALILGCLAVVWLCGRNLRSL